MRNYVTQQNPYGENFVLTKNELLKRVRLFNRDSRIQDWGIKIVVTGSSETYSYHTRLRGEHIRIDFEVYADGDWGLSTTRDLSEEENTLYHQAWGVWCYKGLNSHLA